MRVASTLKVWHLPGSPPSIAIVSVLSREELRVALAAQPPLVDGIDQQTQLQPNGIDLRIDRVQRLTSPGLLGAAPNLREPAAREDVQPDADGWWDLHPGGYVIGYAEKVNLPPDVMAFARPRSTLLRSGVAIDMPAGPSEVAVLADETCEPSFVAADLLSQAEHGPDSQVVLVSTSETVINETLAEVDRQIELLPRKTTAAAAIQNSTAILVSTIDEGVEILNDYAPEHLIIATDNAETVAEQIVNAGSVFIGNFSCESAGDYASGTNHTLPTGAAARAYSSVSVTSFTKTITFQRLTAEGIRNLGPTIETMAAAEGLEAHRNAVAIRREWIGGRDDV